MSIEDSSGQSKNSYEIEGVEFSLAARLALYGPLPQPKIKQDELDKIKALRGRMFNGSIGQSSTFEKLDETANASNEELVTHGEEILQKQDGLDNQNAAEQQVEITELQKLDRSTVHDSFSMTRGAYNNIDIKNSRDKEYLSAMSNLGISSFESAKLEREIKTKASNNFGNIELIIIEKLREGYNKSNFFPTELSTNYDKQGLSLLRKNFSDRVYFYRRENRSIGFNDIVKDTNFPTKIQNTNSGKPNLDDIKKVAEGFVKYLLSVATFI